MDIGLKLEVVEFLLLCVTYYIERRIDWLVIIKVIIMYNLRVLITIPISK